MSCKYIKPWIGKCNEKCEGEYCQEHTDKKCCICGGQATRGCDNTQFLVCGAPLCNNKMCDTIHQVYSHGWGLKEVMKWMGREHTTEEVAYINNFITERKAELSKIIGNR